MNLMKQFLLLLAIIFLADNVASSSKGNASKEPKILLNRSGSPIKVILKHYLNKLFD